MILLWRPQSMSEDHYRFWAHCWKLFAEQKGEIVMAANWDASNIRRAWDTVNQTTGRFVLWTRPEFIPSVAMFAELDYLLDQRIRIVIQTRYNVAFAPGHEEPVSWTPDGVDSSLVVFQLAGQSRLALPLAGSVDIWKWLRQERASVYHVPQRFSGAHGREAWASRSILGETVYSSFAQPHPSLPITRDRQLALWHGLLQAWRIWLTSTSSA